MKTGQQPERNRSRHGGEVTAAVSPDTGLRDSLGSARMGLMAIDDPLTIDSGWREVADTALAFTQRFSELWPAGAGTASS
jgi:hypothetical protein